MSVAVEQTKESSSKGKHHLVPTAETSESDDETYYGASGVAQYETNGSATTNPPFWSHPMCSTFTCVSGLFCWSCYLANVMSYLGLNLCAQPSRTCGGNIMIAVVVGLFMFCYVVDVYVSLMLRDHAGDEEHEMISVLPISSIRAAIAVFLMVLVMLTRSHMRRRYNIRMRACTPSDGCEDCILACCCTSCVVAQMEDYVQTTPFPPDVY